MVRFGVPCLLILILIIFRFNSSMVRFGAVPDNCLILNLKSFNSSMVRFGDAIPCGVLAIHSEFQFQYGAIWRAAHTVYLNIADTVSIPVWCDLEFHSVVPVGD